MSSAVLCSRSSSAGVMSSAVRCNSPLCLCFYYFACALGCTRSHYVYPHSMCTNFCHITV